MKGELFALDGAMSLFLNLNPILGKPSDN